MGSTYTEYLRKSLTPTPPPFEKKKKQRTVLPPKVMAAKESKQPKPKAPKPKPIATPASIITPTTAAIVHATKIPERTTKLQHILAPPQTPLPHLQQVSSPSPTPSSVSHSTPPMISESVSEVVKPVSGSNNVASNNNSPRPTELSIQEKREYIAQRRLELQREKEAIEANNLLNSTNSTRAKKAKLTSDDEEGLETTSNKTTEAKVPASTDKLGPTVTEAADPQNITVEAAPVKEETTTASKVPSQNTETTEASNQSQVNQSQATIKKVTKAAKKSTTPTKTRHSTRMVIPTLSAPISRPTRTSRSTATQSTSNPLEESTALSSKSTTTPPARLTRGSTRNTQSNTESTTASQSRATRSSTTTSSTTTATTSNNTQPNTRRGRKRTADISDEDDEEEQSIQPSRAPKRTAISKRTKKLLPILDESYKLSIVFNGHTHINIPAKDINDDELDDAKDLWCCEFEPSIPNQTEASSIVAFCGSYSVLFMDTHLGHYTKKYTHSEIQEIFYCMAWTTLSGKEELLNADINEEDSSCNILAVAGRLGSIKLLNPLQNECYRYLFGHDKAVLKLAFAKTEPRWLLSASADKTVRLWDIGSPTSKHDDSVCLAKFILPTKSSVPSALSISHDLKTVMVGFEEGDMIRFRITQNQLDTFRSQAVEEKRLKEAKSGDKWAHFGTLATIESKTIYPEGDEWHEGYIDDIYMFGQDGDQSSKLYNKIISRGAEDMEFIIWDPNSSTKKDADILLSLAWPDSQNCTGVRFKVIEKEGQKVLIAGEYDGRIYIYNIGDMKQRKKLADNSVEQEEPTRILSHPMSSELIRDVCCSNDTRTIVAVDNNNTVFVWNCVSPANN